MLLLEETTSWADAQAALEAEGLGDGLPLVPPTENRLASMLAGVSDPERSFGQLPPLFGELRPDAVAYQCVLAGCRPAEFPLVFTAAEASGAPAFNLLGISTTTGSPAVAIVVHGRLGDRLGVNASTNCLGPGHRANACIGRALSLVLRNIAGAKENVGDMATMGQPGKYTFCFAENPDGGFPTFAERRGIPSHTDAVSVLGVSGTTEVVPVGGAGTPESILQPIAAALGSTAALSGAGRERAPGEQVFLLPPELAQTIHNAGWDLSTVQSYLFREGRAMSLGDMGGGRPEPGQADRGVARAPDAIHPIVTGGAGVKMTYLPLWAGSTSPITREVRDLARSP